MAMGIEIKGPTLVALDPEDLNVVLKSLEEQPLRVSRKVFNIIERAAVEQHGNKVEPVAPKAD
jgi:hypothetical protein